MRGVDEAKAGIRELGQASTGFPPLQRVADVLQRLLADKQRAIVDQLGPSPEKEQMNGPGTDILTMLCKPPSPADGQKS